ncbi:MAG: hypothetical protein ACI96W_002960 [Paraglaciecola sp.]|jgi:hypothetical protein
MELDIESANKKELEVKKSLKTSLIGMGLEASQTEEFISDTLKASILVRAPKKPLTVADVAAGAGKARTPKPGNVKLNITALIDQIVKTQIPGVHSKPEPWLGVYAFIEVLRVSSNLKNVKITENDAMVIWSMWFIRNRRSNTISSEDLLTKINTHITRYERTALTQADLNDSIKNLEKISTIRESKNSPESWYLVGWVKRSYS